MHYFYFTTDPQCKTNLPTEEMGEIRSNFQYVVAPGSFVLCDDETLAAMPESQRAFAGRYTVENARSPDTIIFSEMPPVFLEQARKNKEAARDTAKKRKEKADARKDKKPARGSSKNKSALWDLSMEDVVGHIPTAKDRFPSLFHASDTGKNTATTDNGGLSCWRHLVTHTPLSALCVVAGISDCLAAGQGHGGGKPSGIDYDDGQTIFKMWQYAKRNRILPKDDPIPTNALLWYATEHGICKPGEVVDGWKLPAEAYNQAITLLEVEEKVSAGRKKIVTPAPETPPPAGAEALSAMGEALDRKVDSIDIAESLQKTNPIIYDKTRQFWVWDDMDTMYHPIDETDVFNALRKVAGLRGGVVGSSRSAYLQAIKLTGRELEVKEPEDSWITFADCVIDYQTGERFKATKEYLFVNTIPHKYGDSTDTPTIDRLFTEWVGAKWSEMLYEITAYCILNSYPIHRVFLLLGSGRNGKGQFLNFVQRFLGYENTVSTDFERLMDGRFETVRLYRKKAAIMGETNFKEISKTAMFKQLSGGDLSVRRRCLNSYLVGT
jgi:putative DNA primase/helicase